MTWEKHVDSFLVLHVGGTLLYRVEFRGYSSYKQEFVLMGDFRKIIFSSLLFAFIGIGYY